MEQQTAAKNQKPEQSDDMQYNFAAMQQEQAVQMLKKTNLQELSDAECRQVLEEVTNLLRGCQHRRNRQKGARLCQKLQC